MIGEETSLTPITFLSLFSLPELTDDVEMKKSFTLQSRRTALKNHLARRDPRPTEARLIAGRFPQRKGGNHDVSSPHKSKE